MHIATQCKSIDPLLITVTLMGDPLPERGLIPSGDGVGHSGSLPAILYRSEGAMSLCQHSPDLASAGLA
jgi:hypothetical protein